MRSQRLLQGWHNVIYLGKVQRDTFRESSNCDRNTDELLRTVNWVKLDRQRLVDKSIMMYKIVNRMAPDYLCSHFVFLSDTLTYNLRESDFSLAIPQPRTNYCMRSLSYSGAVLWNGLPLDMRQSPSLNVFKSKLKELWFLIVDLRIFYFVFIHGSSIQNERASTV